MNTLRLKLQHPITLDLEKKKLSRSSNFHIDFNDESIDNQTILNLGAFSRINNLSIGTNIVSYFEKLKEGDDSFSYLGVSLSYIFD